MGGLHRGTDLEIEAREDRCVAITMLFPARLFARLNLVGFAGGYRALAEVTNGRAISANLENATPTSATYKVRWR